MGLMIEEQETHVNFMRNDERAIVYTSDSTMMTKLNKLVELQDTEWKLESISTLRTGEVIGKTYSCPVGFISFRSKRVNRSHTDEQKRKIADRLRRMDFKPDNYTSQFKNEADNPKDEQFTIEDDLG